MTETFVYKQIIGNKHYRHVVFTREVKNKEIFPIDSLVLIKDSKELEESLKEHKIDLLHAHFGPSALLALESKSKLNIPMLTFFHGFDVKMYPMTRSKFSEYRDLFLKGEAFAVPSNALKKELIALGCPEDKITVCYLGIDIQRIPFRQRKLDSHPIRILSIGRLVEKKGHDNLIEALSLVEKKIPHFQLHIIGGGDKYEELQQIIHKFRLEQKVFLLGAIPHHKTLEMLQQAHLFCLASRHTSDGDMEGLPVSLLEAQAAGIPIISTKHSGIPEGVLDGRSGYLAEENNPKDLADKLMTLMNHTENWPKFGKVGRQWIEKQFHDDNERQQLMNIYRKMGGFFG